MLTSEEIQERLLRLEQQIGAAIVGMTRATTFAEEVTQLALARVGGHFTIDEAAIALSVSVPTIKRKIKSGEFTLDMIPGTRVYGIPASEIFERWTPALIQRKALKRQREAIR